MEEPIQFNLWGKIVPDRRNEALAFIRQQAIFPSEIELRKAAMSSIGAGKHLQISSALGLRAATALSASIGTLFNSFTLCQEGYAPAGEKSYCSVHNLHYGGCLGCHICNDFYRE